MTTREEALKLDPDVFFWVGFHSIHIDDGNLFKYAINEILGSTKSRKRARMVVHEDAIRATGIWTPEDAGDVAERLIIGPGGNFTDPQLRKGMFRLFQYIGLIK